MALLPRGRRFNQRVPLLDLEAPALCNRLADQISRPDLREEMAGLEWSLGVVDLRLLLAFQRRLVLNPNVASYFLCPQRTTGPRWWMFPSGPRKRLSAI